jgi:hypothetical protein
VKNYYSILGIARTATANEIKQVYRQLAWKYHPDRNMGSKAAEERFKEITEAYLILSDEYKKSDYDFRYEKSHPNEDARNQHQRAEPSYRAAPDFRAAPRGAQGSSNDNNTYTYTHHIREEEYEVASDRSVAIWIICIICLIVAAGMYILITGISSEAEAQKKVEAQARDAEVQKLRNMVGQRSKLQRFYDDVKGTGILTENSTYSRFEQIMSDPTRAERLYGAIRETGAFSSFPDTFEEFAVRLELPYASLIADGYKKIDVKTGQMTGCYNFTPIRGDVDNYLEVKVGGGTDVVIKVMNLRTNRCVRYVFINSRTTHRIRHIPEGRYYLKIAYGKDWFAKEENGRCVGKFLRNPLYEKGDDILNFTVRENEDGYLIPSYQLRLDVISTNTMNSFDSHRISADEFNE